MGNVGELGLVVAKKERPPQKEAALLKFYGRSVPLSQTAFSHENNANTGEKHYKKDQAPFAQSGNRSAGLGQHNIVTICGYKVNGVRSNGAQVIRGAAINNHCGSYQVIATVVGVPDVNA